MMARTITSSTSVKVEDRRVMFSSSVPASVAALTSVPTSSALRQRKARPAAGKHERRSRTGIASRHVSLHEASITR